jgi:hypothetical protein
MDEILGQTFARQRFSALLLTDFSLAALLLAPSRARSFHSSWVLDCG